jgi:hypothetical protein
MGGCRLCALRGAWPVPVVEAGTGLGNICPYPGERCNSLALDGEGRPHIAYYDFANYDLKYASACVPVSGVQVDGPRSLLVEQPGQYRAWALPGGASRPITFTWDNGTVASTAVYSWPATGTYTLTVTATNPCEGVQTASMAVTVLAEWPYSIYLPLVLRGDASGHNTPGGRRIQSHVRTGIDR